MAGRTPLKRVRVAVEPNGSYAQDLTGTIGDLDDLRFTTAELARTTQSLPDEAAVQRVHQRRVIQRGFKGATLDMSGDFVPLAAEYNAAASPAQDALSLMIEAMLGGQHDGAGSTIEASPSPTTTSFTVAAGHGSRFARGQLILVETTATSERFELAMVKGISTDAITLSWALSFTPAAASKVLNGDVLYPATVLPSAATSLQFLVEGEDRDHIWLALGCQGPLSIEWPLGGKPTWSSQFMAATWMHDDEIAAPQGGAALAVATMPGGAPVPIIAGSIVLSPISGTLRTLPTVAECAITTGISWQPVDSYNGVEGKAQMAYVRGEQATASLLVLADDESWSDAYAAGTKYRICAQAGTTGGGTVGWVMGTCELIAEPTLEDRNGLEWWRLQFGALENEDAGTQDTDLARAPFVLFRG